MYFLVAILKVNDMKYFIGIDVGTSGTKSVLISENGKLLASSSYEYSLYQPYNGWAEQEPEDWWKATVQSLHDIVCNSGVTSNDILGIGLSGQMHGLVMLDAEKKVLDRSIIWCDQRTSDQKEEIDASISGSKMLQISGNATNTSFTAAKILWVRKNKPEIWSKCRYVMLPKDFIRFKLTGEIYTDASDASGTQLLNVKERTWSKEIAGALGLDMSLLPTILESCEKAGGISPEVAELTGLCAGTAVAAGAADNAAAAVGTYTIREGEAFVTIGTSGVVFAHSSEYKLDPNGRIHTLCSAIPNEYALMGVTQSAGFSLKWFRDTFCDEIIRTSKETGISAYYLIDKMAAKSPIGANRLLFLPYLMGERTPHFDADCRGTFVGLSAIHSKNDVARSVIEGVSYSLCNCIDLLRTLHVVPERIYACGGGSASAFWREMLADVFNCAVCTLKYTEGAALGAAILGSVACGYYSSVEEACKAMISTEGTTVEPSMEKHLMYEKYYEVYNTLYVALKNSYALLQSV